MTLGRFITLYVLNLVFNALVAFWAFGYVSVSGGWSWDRATNALDSLFGGFWGAVLVAVVLFAVLGLIIYAVVVEYKSKSHRLAVGLGLLTVVVGAALAGDALFTGKGVFMLSFVALFALETFVDHYVGHRKVSPAPVSDDD